MQTYRNTLRSLLRHSASAVVVATACVGATVGANASTIALTSANSPYSYDKETGNVIEVTSGSAAYLTAYYNPVPTGYLGLIWNSTPALSSTTADTIKIDKGASLYLDNPWWWQQTTSLFDVEGDITIAHGTTNFMGANSFLGNVTLEDSAAVSFGQSYSFAATYFGTSTNIILGSGAQANFYEPHSMTNTINSISSKDSTASVLFNNGSLTVNGINTAASAYYGSVDINPGATFMVGDATHSTAVFGDVAGSSTIIEVYQAGGTLGTLSGYGTIYGTVYNSANPNKKDADGNPKDINIGGIVKPGGTKGTAGTLTINGNYTQGSGGQLLIGVTSTGVSKLVVNGAAKIDGSLILDVESATTTNGVYNVLTATSVSGSFATTTIKGDTTSALVGIEKTSTGYAVVTEKATSAQIVNHAINANRGLISSFARTLLERSGADAADGAGEIHAWAQPFARVDNVGAEGVGYNATYGGLIGGAEYRFSDLNAVIGGSVAYAHGSMDIKNEKSTLTSNSVNLAVYGGLDLLNARVDGVAFYNIFTNDAKRDVGTYGKEKSSPSGYSYGASLQISRPIFDNLLSPFVRGLMSGNHLDGKTETGSDSFALTFDSVNKTAFSGDIGVKIHALAPTPEQNIKLDFSVAVSHEFSQQAQDVSGLFAHLSNAPFAVTWKGNSPNALLLGTEFSTTLSDGLDVFGRINGQFTTKERAGELFIGGRYKF